jgi:hypothetical protein
MATKIKVTVHRPQPKKLDAHKPKPSSTLMRRTVVKPEPTLKRRVKAIGAAEYGLAVHQPMKIIANPDLIRPNKAYKSVPQSPLINHFSDVRPAIKRASPAQELKPEITPAHKQLKPANSADHPSATKTRDLINNPTFEIKDLLGQISQPKKSKKKYVNKIWLASLLLFAILFFFGSQKFNSEEAKPAAIKTTTSISLPKGLPSSYRLVRSNQESGQLNLYFDSIKSPSKIYTLTEKDTLWDSAELKSNYINVSYPNATSVLAGSNQVYLYGSGDASWIDNGVWYTVNSNNNLSANQMITIAENS